jgi:hypothetical protein
VPAFNQMFRQLFIGVPGLLKELPSPTTTSYYLKGTVLSFGEGAQ